MNEEDVKQIELAKEAEIKYPGPEDLTHLHSHSLFSTLDGVADPKQYIERAKQLGMKAFALTDHGSMAGLPDLYWAAKEHNITPIAGCELYLNCWHPKMIEYQNKGIDIATIKATDPEFMERYRRNRHLTAICKDQTGFKNLIGLMCDAFEFGLYYNKPRTWVEKLQQYQDGLIILSGCLNGPICHELRKGMEHKHNGDNAKGSEYYRNAIQYVKQMREIFGDNFYIELQMPGANIENAKEVYFQMSYIAKKFGIPAVMTGDMHYLHRRDFELQKTMMAVEQGVKVDDPNLFHVDSDEGFFKNRAQFRQTFNEHGYKHRDFGPDWFETACDNTIKITEKCSGFKPDLTPKLPEVENADETLSRLVAQALIKKGLYNNPKKYQVDGTMVTYKEQAKIELKRIIDKKFSSYFLITRNLIQFAKENDCSVGPARGSAGGSLICYLLGITHINPLSFGLSFDRFLSPARGGYMLNIKM
jgi:DNA polymerase-3 subunit alpha